MKCIYFGWRMCHPTAVPSIGTLLTQVTESLITNTSDCQTHFIEAKQDHDQIYVVWDDELSIFPNNGLYYWQVGSPSKITVSETIQESDFGFKTSKFSIPPMGKFI